MCKFFHRLRLLTYRIVFDETELFISFIENIESKKLQILDEIRKIYKDNKDINTMLTEDIKVITNDSKKGTLK